MTADRLRLRVALLAGTLARGGAEKQLLYMAEALCTAGVDVRVYAFDEGGEIEAVLRGAGVPVTALGVGVAPPGRLVAVARALRSFRPHIAQAGHFYTNLYVVLAARACGAMPLGAIRSDTTYDVRSTGALGRASLHLPPSLLANSHAARRNAMALGVPGRRLHVMANVIEPGPSLESAMARNPDTAGGGPPVAMIVGRLVPAKRIDRFLAALARARAAVPELQGVIVGQGPERGRLEAIATGLGLNGSVRFHGHSPEVSALLTGASLLALTSEHEGFPNVLLEAMAAGLPVVTTPAGDAALVVEEGVTGFVVPGDDLDALAERMVRLARSPALRRSLGSQGARRIRQHYSTAGLAGRLLATYLAIAEQQGRPQVAEVVRHRLTLAPMTP